MTMSIKSGFKGSGKVSNTGTQWFRESCSVVRYCAISSSCDLLLHRLMATSFPSLHRLASIIWGFYKRKSVSGAHSGLREINRTSIIIASSQKGGLRFVPSQDGFQLGEYRGLRA